MPRNETPADKVRREQRELMDRLNAERDKKMTTRQQNDARMRGAPPAPPRAQAAQPSRPVPAGGPAMRARNARIDEVVSKATGEKPRGRR
jgi:hypothetical protein